MRADGWEEGGVTGGFWKLREADSDVTNTVIDAREKVGRDVSQPPPHPSHLPRLLIDFCKCPTIAQFK